MKQVYKRKFLAGLVCCLMLIGVSLVSIPFVSSLRPTQVALNNYILEVDLNGLMPGQALRLDWWGTVIVLHRTPEQIAWLSSYVPPEIDEFYDHIQDELYRYGNIYRSVSPNYLVLWFNGTAGNTYLQEFHQFLQCPDLEYFENNIQVAEDVFFPGGFICNWPGYRPRDRFLDNPYVYDVAGRSTSYWLAPIATPEYSISADGVLTLGKAT